MLDNSHELKIFIFLNGQKENEKVLVGHIPNTSILGTHIKLRKN